MLYWTKNHPPPPQGSVVLYEWVVQGRGQPRAVACLSNPWADHSGARRDLLPGTTPKREYYHIRRYFTSGGLSTYGGRYRVGGLEA